MQKTDLFFLGKPFQRKGNSHDERTRSFDISSTFYKETFFIGLLQIFICQQPIIHKIFIPQIIFKRYPHTFTHINNNFTGILKPRNWHL